MGKARAICAAAAAAAAVAAASACDGEPADSGPEVTSAVVVNLVVLGGISGAVQIRSLVEIDGEQSSALLPQPYNPSSPIDFPTTYGILFAGEAPPTLLGTHDATAIPDHLGTATVSVEALDISGHVLGSGSIEVAVGNTTEYTSMTLAP